MLFCHSLEKILNLKPIFSLNSNLYFKAVEMISLGFKNLFQSCVPFGSQFNMYSAPTIANKNDLAVLLSVAKNIIPFFLIV